MLDLERDGVRGDPEREAKVWLDKLAEVDRKRSKFQDMAAEGLITFDELGSKLAGLEEIRKTIERELEALERRRENLERLEHDRETLLKTYVEMTPEALETLRPEERHHLYKMLRLEVQVCADGSVEVNGAFGEPVGLDTLGSVKASRDLSSRSANSKTAVSLRSATRVRESLDLGKEP